MTSATATLAQPASTMLPRKRRSRKNSLPYAISFFLFFLVVLGVNYALSDLTLKGGGKRTRLKDGYLGQVSVRSGADYGDLCSNGVLSSKLSLLFIIPVIIFCFIGLAIVTDDYFVAALEQICSRLKLSEDVAGATFMAAGSSTPEFFSSMIGTFITKDEVGVGTIVGSAVFNILIIIGLSAALAGTVLHLDWRPLLRDSTFYVISIILLFVFTFVSSKGVVDWWEGLILVATYAVYILFMAFGNKPFMKQAAKLGWFGIHPESDDVETGGNNIEQRVSTTSATQQQQQQHESLQHQHTQELNIEAIASNDTIPSSTTPPSPVETANAFTAMEQPSPRRVGSLSRTSVVENGAPRYRDLHLRTRLRAAQMSIIAIERMKNDVRRKREREEGEASSSGASKDEVAIEMGRHDSGSDEEDKPEFFGVELPSSYIGWILFPFTFTWKILYRYTIVDCSKEGNEKYWLVTFLTSIIWISGVSYGMVELTRVAGCLLNIPATAMGLTVLAAGTSIPDALASISVARDGAGDMAVSNAIGSNVFDILLGLGVPWFIGDLALPTPEGQLGPITIETSPITEVIIPIIILFSIMVAFVLILIALKWTMRPLLGYLLCGLYVVFVTYTLLDVYVLKIGQ